MSFVSRRPLRSLIGGGVMVLLGGAGLVITLPRPMEAVRSQDWPATRGKLVAAAIDRTRSRRRIRYDVDLRYTYVVEGRRLESERWSVNGSPRFTSRSDAEEFLERHPVGSELTVRYDPEDPTSAVVVAGGEPKAWMNVGFSVVVIVLGLFLGLRGYATLAAMKRGATEMHPQPAPASGGKASGQPHGS